MRDFIKKQKQQVKYLSERLEADKAKYKADKADVELLRLKDPELYKKKSAVLEKVN